MVMIYLKKSFSIFTLHFLVCFMQNLQAKEAKSEDYISQLSEELANMQQQNEDMTLELKVLYCKLLLHINALIFVSRFRPLLRHSATKIPPVSKI